MQVPDAAERSPDVGWLFGEATCFLQGGGSQEQTAPVQCLQAIRGWGERAEQHKADSSSYPVSLGFFPSCYVQVSEGRVPGCPQDHQPLQQEAPRHAGRGTWGAAPSTQTFICTQGSASPSSSSSRFEARMTRNGTRCLQAPDKLPKLLSGGQNHPCPVQSSKTSSLTCDTASQHRSASPHR